MNQIKVKANPTFLKISDFQTIQIRVMFPFYNQKEDLAFSQLLPGMLNYMNAHYPSEEEFQLAKKKLFILNAYCTRSVIGDLGAYSFILEIPDTKALGENLLEEQIRFFSELIYEPRVEDEHFLDFELEREKTNLNLFINNSLKNIQPYQRLRIREEIDDVGILSRSIIRNQELIDAVTTSNLYKFYLDKIRNNHPAIYIMGNVNEEEITTLCKKYLYQEKFSDYEVSANLYHYLTPRDGIHSVTEESTFQNSVISYAYKVKDMKFEDTIYLNILSDLLNSLSSRLLSKKLRDENDLIYHSYGVSYPHFGAFEITAYINQKNQKIACQRIEEVIQDLKNEEIISDALEHIKERKRINTIKKLDNKYLIFADFIFKDLGIDITTEDYYEQLKKVQAKDIVKFVDRLVLDTTYFLKEDCHE